MSGKTPTWKRALAAVTQPQRDAACREMDGWSRRHFEAWDRERRQIDAEHPDLVPGDSDWVAFHRIRADIARQK